MGTLGKRPSCDEGFIFRPSSGCLAPPHHSLWVGLSRWLGCRMETWLEHRMELCPALHQQWQSLRLSRNSGCSEECCIREWKKQWRVGRILGRTSGWRGVLWCWPTLHWWLPLQWSCQPWLPLSSPDAYHFPSCLFIQDQRPDCQQGCLRLRACRWGQCQAEGICPSYSFKIQPLR